MPKQVERPLGVWLIARTRSDRPYPCRCWLGKRCTKKCWCFGRIDVGAHLPAHCCAMIPSHR